MAAEDNGPREATGDATDNATGDDGLVLSPPEPVAALAPEKAAGLVPVGEEEKSAIGERVRAFVDTLAATNPHSPEFGRRVDQLAALGQREIERTARHSSRFLDRPVKAMDGETGVGTDLAELRRTIEALDPAAHGQLTAKRRILGLIPFGNRAQRYFDRYRSASTHISAILKRLEGGKDELLRDNAAIDIERRELWNAMGRLEQMIYMSKTLDHELETVAARKDGEDPEGARAIRETALFHTRQRTTDLMTQMAVAVQGYLALDLVKKNNRELVKGVDRASTTTVAALRTAVTVAQALTNQKLVLDQVTALNTTTANVVAATGKALRTQTGEIHKQAAGAMVPVETLKQAFADIYATMDSIDEFKGKALIAMRDTVDALSGEVERARTHLARAESVHELPADDNPLLLDGETRS